MKIFLSHASQLKPLVKNVVKYLPANLTLWLDEQNLIWGDNLNIVFEKVIKTEIDYLIIFLNEVAGNSQWVRKELCWALQREKELQRIFVLPVLIRSEDDHVFEFFPELHDRKNIQIFDYTELGMKATADQIMLNMFSLICEDLKRMQAPPPVSICQTVNAAESLIIRFASDIRSIVFPRRRNNPIPVDELYRNILKRTKDFIGEDEFYELLELIMQRNLIPGLAYDGFELYLIEEHSLWKAQLNYEKKTKIARKAATYIRNGMKIYIDAGSTTEQIISILCKRIETHMLNWLTIVTPSIKHADMISECCVKLGYDDISAAIHLYLPGDRVRLGTQALVPLNDSEESLSAFAEELGGYDLAFIGANGITEAGLTTHINREMYGKRVAYEHADKRIIVCDASKYGIQLEYKLAEFADDFTLVSNSSTELEKLKDKYPNKIILV